MINIYSKYQFTYSAFKIPIKFGNNELKYIFFITKIQTNLIR